MNGIILNFEKLVKAITAKGAPEAKAYLSLLNEELGYVKLSDLKLLGKMILGSMKTLQAVPETVRLRNAWHHLASDTLSLLVLNCKSAK